MAAAIFVSLVIFALFTGYMESSYRPPQPTKRKRRGKPIPADLYALGVRE